MLALFSMVAANTIHIIFLDDCLYNHPHNFARWLYDRMDVSEGIDYNKTGGSCECVFCHYWYFLGINFRFQWKVFHGCHDMTQKSMSFDDVMTITIKGEEYRTNF